MQADRLDHVGIKVQSIEQSISGFANLGFRTSRRQTFPKVGIEIAFLELGTQRFELLQSLNDNSPIALDADGLHHLAFRCTDLPAAYAEMRADSRYQLLGEPSPGAHGTPVLFFRVRATSALLELVGSLPANDREIEIWRW